MLVRQPRTSEGQNAGPPFGFYAFDPNREKKIQPIELRDAVLGHFPSLGGDDGVRQLIEHLPSV